MDDSTNAPARRKRATHRIDYTPELVAELRRLYEQTPQSCDTIAATGGITRPTLRLLAKREGWSRFRRGPLDLSPAVRLEARLADTERQLAAQRAHAPACAGEPAAAPVADSNCFDANFRLTAARALEEAQAQIATLKAAREQAEESGRFSRLSYFTRELQVITNSLARIKRMYGGATEGVTTGNDDVSDLDAFRDRLAHTIDTLVDEWLHADDAGPSRREDPVPDRT